MQFLTDNLLKIKNGVHVFQGVLIFVAWVLMITVWRSNNAEIDGRPGWYFGLCFLTVPALIYQTMTPMFERSKKLAHPYAFVSIDLAFAILWFSAFVSVAAWNSSGKCGEGCTLSKVDVGLGFFVFATFALTLFMSLQSAMEFRRTGNLPTFKRKQNANIDPDAEAFSTAPNDEYAPLGMHDQDPKDDHSDLDINHVDRYDTSYHGGSTYGSTVGGGPASHIGNAGSHYAPDYGSEAGYGRGPSPLGMNSRSRYGDDHGRAQFPSGNYD